MNSFYVGVDVGTGSVRAALVDKNGKIKVTAEESISINNPNPDFYEQSSNEIWLKCCALVKQVTKDVSKQEVKGIGFDATCSLVVLDKDFQPVAVNYDNSSSVCYDIIMWMDHRAKEETETINKSRCSVLKYVGGKISLEMQPPKLKWLKNKLPQNWKKACHFFDLCDYLTFKATGSLSRSLCSVTCKWLYSDQTWSKEFWKSIGLEELCDQNFSRIGSDIVKPGSPLKDGLTLEAANNMNLLPNTPVAAGLIDAHCGGIGTIGGDISGLNLPVEGNSVTERISFICGTSSCHMALSSEPLFVSGVWGPYYSAMVPGYWLNEGGQSSTGSLIDHVIQSHPAYVELKKTADMNRQNIYEHLNACVDDLTRRLKLDRSDFITQNFHVTPDYHGNRSPLADPSLCGAVCGLTLDQSTDDLVKQYLATVQAIACGSRHIVEMLEKQGHRISVVFMCGGLSKNRLFVQIHADLLNRPVVLGRETESVLLGASILGACASGDFPSIQDAMLAMSKPLTVFRPHSATRSFYDKKYQVFMAMTKHQLEYRTMMEK